MALALFKLPDSMAQKSGEKDWVPTWHQISRRQDPNRIKLDPNILFFIIFTLFSKIQKQTNKKKTPLFLTRSPHRDVQQLRGPVLPRGHGDGFSEGHLVVQIDGLHDNGGSFQDHSDQNLGDQGQTWCKFGKPRRLSFISWKSGWNNCDMVHFWGIAGCILSIGKNFVETSQRHWLAF